MLQRVAGRCDKKSDIFSLRVILWGLITQTRPWDGPSEFQVRLIRACRARHQKAHSHLRHSSFMLVFMLLPTTYDDASDDLQGACITLRAEEPHSPRTVCLSVRLSYSQPACFKSLPDKSLSAEEIRSIKEEIFSNQAYHSPNQSEYRM